MAMMTALEWADEEVAAAEKNLMVAEREVEVRRKALHDAYVRRHEVRHRAFVESGGTATVTALKDGS